MSLIAGRRNLLLVVLVVGVGVVVATFFFKNRERSIDPAQAAALAESAGDDLASTTVETSIAISVTTPDLQDAQRFSAQGTADFRRQGAALTYDFEELTNAAGGFGHLDEFDVVFDKDLVYIQIFQGRQPWISFRPPEMVGLDMERLREVVLSSPLVLPDYLGNLREVTGTAEGDMVVVEGTVVPSILTSPASGVTAEFQELLAGLEADTISVTVQIDGGVATHVDYRFGFPAVLGSEKDVVARVTTDFERSEAAEIVAPESSETRSLESFVD